MKGEKIPHRNRSQVQVSLKVTAQIDHLNITVPLDLFLMFDIFSIDQSPEIAGKLNNHIRDYKWLSISLYSLFVCRGFIIPK